MYCRSDHSSFAPGAAVAAVFAAVCCAGSAVVCMPSCSVPAQVLSPRSCQKKIWNPATQRFERLCSDLKNCVVNNMYYDNYFCTLRRQMEGCLQS